MERLLSEKISRLLEHTDDLSCRQELAALLAKHPELVESYIEQLRVHSLLEWSLASAPSTTEEFAIADSISSPRSPRMSRIAAVILVTAATLALVAFGALYQTRFAPVGEIVAAQNIAWAEGARQLAVGESFRPGVLEATSGSCTLRFDSGVELLCEGAFRLDIVSDMLIELDYGKLRANVPECARGFSVDTPDTFLVDQGTEFGVTTEVGDGTKVVVFQGEVDVRTKHINRRGSTRRLSQGEAARLLSGHSNLARVTQVTSGGQPTNWSAGGSGALLSIRDNIRAADSLKYYNVIARGLHEDVPAWVDRVHEWNGVIPEGIPAIVRGADYVQTFNDDRYNPSFKMFVTVHQPCTLFVFIDHRVANLPKWLVREFQNTGEHIGLDEGLYQNYRMESARGAGQSIDQSFSIWQRVVPEPTELELGGIDSQPKYGMYGLAAKPLESVAIKRDEQ